MPSLVNDPGLGSLQTTATNVGAMIPVNLLLYLLVGVILFIIVNMLMNKNISFDFIKKLLPAHYRATSNASLFWKPGSQFTNLKEKGLLDFPDNSYTMLIDCVIYESRSYNTTDGPYRHIVHRGSEELGESTVGGFVTSGCSRGTNTSNLPPFGLPRLLNPGIFLDPNTNDIIVFVDTENGLETFRESVRVADLPLNKPFRIGIILNSRVLEVYLNCRLEVTKVLAGEPKKVQNIWYGLAGSANAQAQIQNLYVWKNPITADDIRPLCPAIPTFGIKRPICNSADQTIKKSARPGEKSIDLGFGASVKHC